MSELQKPPAPEPRRPWYWDALASLTFWGQAFWLGKFFSRGFPAIGLFVFLIFAGLGWMFGRSARRGLLEGREKGRK